jgi:archaellum component FlaF (FlaF/FlaG flagellin family)
MIKYTILLINFAGLFLFNLFTDAEILVENNTPTYLVPGQKKEVHVRINKKSIEGFAKMEIQIPAGFVLTAGETLGASFTCSQQKARFVWMTLPQQEDFVVTYFLECIEGMSGNHSMTGVFSYIKDNKRLDYLIPVRSVSIVKEEPTVQADTPASAPFPISDSQAGNSMSVTSSAPAGSTSSGNDPSAQTNNNASRASVESPGNNSVNAANQSITTAVSPATATSGATEETTATTATTTRKSTANRPVSQEAAIGSSSESFVKPLCTRRIDRISDEQFEVTVTISENDIQGFARIFEIVPNGCSTEVVQDGAAMTTREANTVKFVWFEVPSSPIVIVKYKVSCTTAVNGPLAINGKLSFVLDQKPVDLMIVNEGDAPADVVIAQTPVTTPSSLAANDKEKNKSADAAMAETQPKKPVTNNNSGAANGGKKETVSTESANANDRGKPATTVPSAETGLKYKIQILAAHRVVDKSYFQKKHGYKEGFNIETHEGWVKYTTGSFGEYRSARDERERLKTDYNSLPGPFVTAYNNGERITVQEALLITKQQWYK